MPSFNDLNLENWKDSEAWTDSLWIISERDKTGKHNGYYHGNFVPQIPHQLILRYTKKDDVVFDPFVGSGTTAYEAESLGRNFVGVDIQSELIKQIQNKVDNKDFFTELLVGDSTEKTTFEKIAQILAKKNKKNFQLAVLHPPYADIIKFSNHKEDLSNSTSLKDFLNRFAQVVKNTIGLLEKGRYLAIVMGDKYTQGQWIPLGFYCLNEAQKLGLILKSIIVKNMEGNRAKQNKEGIWRYRSIAIDFDC